MRVNYIPALYPLQLIICKGEIPLELFFLRRALLIFSLSLTSHVLCNLSRAKISFLSLTAHKLQYGCFFDVT